MEHFISVVLPIITLSIGFFSVAFTVYHTNVKLSKEREQQNINQGRSQQELISRLDSLATKEYLDSRLKTEIDSLGTGLKSQINDLRIDMKEQINEVKQDIKCQQETTGTMGKEIVKATESAKNAHDRIEQTNKRLDDLKELIIITNKKA